MGRLLGLVDAIVEMGSLRGVYTYQGMAAMTASGFQWIPEGNGNLQEVFWTVRAVQIDSGSEAVGC